MTADTPHGGWRDIESAPRDGTAVWVSNATMSRPVLAKFGSYTELSGQNGRAWVLISDPDPFMPVPAGALVIPDRWQPLIAPAETSHV